MIATLTRIVAKIEQGALLSASTFTELNFDDALNNRELTEFDAEWMRVFNGIVERTLPERAAADINHIRIRRVAQRRRKLDTDGGVCYTVLRICKASTTAGGCTE
jgi:hypothetical protein